MNNSVKLFADDLNNWMVYIAGFKQSQYQISIYYKYSTYVSKLVVLSYVDTCVFWYTYEEPGKWFVDTLGKRLHVIFQGYEHWFMSIRI